MSISKMQQQFQHKKNSLRKMSISKCKKYIYQQFQQTRLPFNRHSRTPGHGLLVHRLLVTNGCPRPDGREKNVLSVVILLKQRNSSSAL
ncbi:hypothetical protein TNCV_2975381 [Trichonephila clavipes]|nr:hypothetical protein TNCV_2975381 [Trichonephila clavipes]